MLRTRWLKVIIDLWRHRARTLIVALAIAVGVYAIGVVITTRELLVREYRSDQDGALMSSAILYTAPFGDDLADRIAQIPGVASAEGRQVASARVRGRTLRELDLIAVPDFADMQVDALTPLEGDWPPVKRGVILERLSLDYLDVELGDSLVVELEGGAEKTLAVVGIAHDAQKLGPNVSGLATGYVTPETMESLGMGRHYTALHIRVAERPRDEAHIQAVVADVEDHLERTGRQVFSRRLITRSIADPFIDTILLILSSFGVTILLLSGLLVVNAISALIVGHMSQIGVMKLIGARRWQIVSLYVVTLLVYGSLAIALAIPLAIFTSRFLMLSLVSDVLNVLPDSLAIPVQTIAVQAVVGLLLPLLAGLAPVLKGTRITTHQALSDVGVGRGRSGRGWLERLVGWLQKLLALRRPVLLAIRNGLRHRGRLAQTLVVLVVGTALFISVVSVWASVDATVEGFLRLHRYDVSIRLQRPYRLARIEQVARGVPGVVAVEGWSVAQATWLRPDGTESSGMRVYAVPPASRFMAPQVSAGEWLPAQDGQVDDAASFRAVVLNSDVLDEEPGLGLRQDLVLDIGGREAVWHVVGIVPTEAQGPAIYVDAQDYGYVTRTPGQATRVQVITTRHDAASQREIEARLIENLEAAGLEVSGGDTTQAMRADNKLIFTIIVGFLVLMALLLAAVGGLGLTTTMSINVLERVREIGVLRAIGASNRSVRKIVLAEGVALGIVSWIVGAILSVPISAFMSEQLGLALIQIPLSHTYSIAAAVAWFFALQAIAVVASLGPARNAERLTIREVLAYE